MRIQTHTLLPFALSIALGALMFSIMSCSSGKQSQGGNALAQTSAQIAQMPPQKSGPQPKQNEKLSNLGLTTARPYAEKAIHIQYRADENLNTYEGKPHTLMLLVYQLGDVNPFNGLIKDAAGLTKLLQGEKFDPSVLSVDRFFIEPGDTNTIDIDRYENVKWVSIVAGYYGLTPGQVTRCYELPVLIETKGVIFKSNEARMGQLKMNLFFGPSSIQEVPSP